MMQLRLCGAVCGLALAVGCSGQRPAAGDATPVVDAAVDDVTPATDAAMDDATPATDAAGDQPPPPADGGPETSVASGPFPTMFEFRNDTAAPLFIFKGCVGIDYGVSSAASGFRDQLAPTFHCSCRCDDASCTGPPACGPCPTPEGVQIPAGGKLLADWDGVYVMDQQKARAGGGTFSCVKSFPQPAGHYRVAIRVFADMASAAAHLGGRVVTRDFDLPSADGKVDVPLAATAADECDSAPQATTPICTGSEAHDVPCSLSQSLGCTWEGGNGLYADTAQVMPPATYARRRMFRDGAMADLTCTTPVPRCARDSRVVTTSDIVRVISEPTVAAAFATGTTPVYGEDARAYDGTILVLRRADGATLGIGPECTGCAKPLTPALRTVVPVFRELQRQSIAAPACSAFGPAFYN